MPYGTRTYSMTGAPATLSSDTTYAHITIPEWATGVIVRAAVGTVTGTSPTLNIYIQGGIHTPGATDVISQTTKATAYTWFDWASLTQITASNTVIMCGKVAAGEEVYAATAGTLAAGSVRDGPIPPVLRVFADVGGTNPSFANFNVTAQFVP